MSNLARLGGFPPGNAVEPRGPGERGTRDETMTERFRHDFDKLNRLPPYSLGEVIALMRAARRAGEDIVDLGMGNPDMPSPPLRLFACSYGL